MQRALALWVLVVATACSSPAATGDAAGAADDAVVDDVGLAASDVDLTGSDVVAADVASDASPVDALADVVPDAAPDAALAEVGAADAAPDAVVDTAAVDVVAADVAVDAGPAKQITVFTILLENHSYADVVGSGNAPYLNALMGKYGLATNYKDSGTHPSLPNYLYLISGSTQYPGVTDLSPTADVPLVVTFPVDKDNLGHQLQVANIPWRSYQESMGTPCLLSDQGDYAPRHDPFLYFTDIQKDPNGLCAQTSVDYNAFPADLASGKYRYMWITPNLANDGHNPQIDAVTSLKNCDAWMAKEVPKILASDAYKNGGILFITWDEGEGIPLLNDIDKVPMIVVTESIKKAGFQSAKAYSHASYLATVEDLFGLPRLGDAATADNLFEFWQP